MRLGDLVIDMSFYPRAGINWTHVEDLKNALLSGTTVPPLIIERSSKRIVDGIHRYNAYDKLYGEEFDARVEERDYRDENELWLAAVELNASHGLSYTTYDRRLILVEAEKRGISKDVVSHVLKMPIEKAEKKLATGSAFVKMGGVNQRVALRTSMKKLAGHTLTKKQQEANKRASLKVGYHVDALVKLLQAGILKWGSKENRVALQSLKKELAKHL
jgi:hypothetical protein